MLKDRRGLCTQWRHLHTFKHECFVVTARAALLDSLVVLGSFTLILFGSSLVAMSVEVVGFWVVSFQNLQVAKVTLSRLLNLHGPKQ